MLRKLFGIIFVFVVFSAVLSCSDVKPESKAFLITTGYGIKNSPRMSRTSIDGKRVVWIFHEWTKKIKLAPGQRAVISSTPDGKGFVIVDDGLFINGKKHPKLYAGFYGDARRSIGRAAEVSYKGVNPIDVTNEIRKDGEIHVQLVDWGVLYASSRLYLVIL